MSIKRYYTFEKINENNDRFSDRLDNYFNSNQKVNLKYGFDSFKAELEQFGVFIVNKEDSIFMIEFLTESEEDANIEERKIKDFAKSEEILIHDAVAKLDYEVICERFTKGKELFNEDILPINMSLYDKKMSLYSFIDGIETQNRTLIVTDPYLYKSKEKAYISLVIDLFQRSKASKICSYMPPKCRNTTYTMIQQGCSQIDFSFINYCNCHDRFWICPESKRGFYIGTSLNGIGTKIHRIDYLRNDEVELLAKELGIITN